MRKLEIFYNLAHSAPMFFIITMSALENFFTHLAHSAPMFFNIIMSRLENDKIKRGKYPGINNTITKH